MKEIKKDNVAKSKNNGNYNRAAIKARQVLKSVTEDGLAVSKAMRKAGYSESYSHNPNMLTDSKPWQDLVDEILPNKTLLDKNKELLDAKKIIIVDGIMEEVQDNAAQNKALELAYRIKGSFAPEKFTILDPLDDLSIEQLENELRELDKQLTRYKKADGSDNYRKTKKGTPESKSKKISK